LNSKLTLVKHRLAKTPVITSDRLTLKEIESHDVASIVDISVYNGVFATNTTEAINVLEQINVDVRNGKSLHWGIFLKDSSELAGTCGYYRGFDRNKGEIGYILRPLYRGLGIMTEAVKLIVAFGFDTLKLDTIIAYTSPTNSESMAILQRAGFKKVKSKHADLKFERHHP
jgi:ribosomal-protein-alanine N-acetyltransferase